MTSQARQSSQGRADKYFDVGVVGRKTGLRVKPNVKKDVDGFDSIEDFWDSGGDENGGDTSQPSDREHQRVHLARRLSQEIYKPSSAISGGYSSSDLSTLPSPFLYRPSNDRRRTSAIPLRKSTTGSTLWDDSSIERARFNEERSTPSLSREMEESTPNPSMQTATDPSLLGVLADYGRIKSQGNFPAPQRDFRSADTSAVTKSHMQSTNPSRDSRNTPARQSRPSDMFARLQHTSTSPMHDYALNPFRDSKLYLLDTPSRPSHSVVPHSMWTSIAVGQRRYDSLGVGVQGSREVSNYLESPVYPSNEEISEPPMYYFPDEDDVIAANNYGQLGIEYDEAAVAEMMAERQKAVGPESIRTAVTITSPSSRQSSRHSSPRTNLLKSQPQKLQTTPKIDRPEAPSHHSSSRTLVSQTTDQQSTSNTDHLRNHMESTGYYKESPAPVTSGVSTSRFERVPTKDHTSKERELTTVLVLDVGAVLGQYVDVDHSMVSAPPKEPKVKAIGKTKSSATRQAESTGNPLSKQTVTTATVRSNAKKPNGEFEEPAPPTVQHERQALIPPQMIVSEIPRAPAPPCDDASVRRSRRTRLQPLEYWKNERAIYELSKTSPDAGRVIKGVTRGSEEPHMKNVKMPPRKKQSTASTRSDLQSKSNQHNVNETVDTNDSCDADDEQEALAQSGFDEEARVEGSVVDPSTGAIVVRTIAESKQTTSRFKVIPESGYKHHAGLACGEISSGVMKIEPDHMKPNRRTNAGTVIFYVTKGRVEVTINDCTFAVTTGGQFMVPRGNQYSIKNASHDDCTIFYARVKTHDAAPVPLADERKDEKKGSTGRSTIAQAKPKPKKQMQPPSAEPSPESSSLSSPEPVAVVTKKGHSKKVASSKK